MSPGKRWEGNFSNGNDTIIRLYDTTSGFAGVKNPCDFLLYDYPYFYPCECKSVAGSRLSFRDITENQHLQLGKMDEQYGVCSLVCVEFREVGRCYAIPYKVIQDLMSIGEKSIGYYYCKKTEEVIEIPTEYSRVNCTVDWPTFLNRLRDHQGGCKYED